MKNKSTPTGSSLALALLAAMPIALVAALPAAAQPVAPPIIADPPADAAKAPDKPYVAPANFSEWAKGITFGTQVEGGITVNPQSPDSRRNFGFTTTDPSNRPILNQALFTVSRDFDPKATTVDIGFKLQAMYGSDARIFQTMGVFDQLIHNRNQLALIEANVTARIPQLFANGLDLKVGLFPTPLGVELIDPKTNAFYSHSYIFNYGLPFKHTGALATAHVSDLVDLYLGVDTGNDAFLAYGAGDNNNRPAGVVGFGLNLPGGKTTILALSHMGPEDSKRLVPFANSAMRYYNDVAVVYKATDKLTLTLETNYIRDDGYRAEAYGMAGYASYAITPTVTLNGRAEVFRDNNNFFVSTPVGDRDFINAQRGTLANLFTANRPTTYSEFTAGLTYKPATIGPLSTLLVRPEIRYDRALNESRPYNDGRNRGSITLASDIVLGF